MKVLLGIWCCVLLSSFALGQEKITLGVKENKVLYRQTGNFLTIVGKEIKNAKTLVYKANNARVMKGAKKGLITIFPEEQHAEVILTVFNGPSKLGVIKFQVRETPKPRIIIYKANGDSLKIKGAVKCPDTIQIRAKIVDEYFKQNYPRDSRYKVSKGTVMLVRGMRPVAGVVPILKNNVILSHLTKYVKQGDHLLIEVTEVQRSRFAGGVETIPVKETIVIPLL